MHRQKARKFDLNEVVFWFRDLYVLAMRQDLETLQTLWNMWVEFGERLTDEEWAHPTRNTEWDVKATYAHHAQAVGRLTEFSQSPTTLPIDHPKASNFLGQFALRPDDPRIVGEMALAESAAATTDELVDTFRARGPIAIKLADEAGDVVVQTDEGRIHIYEYIRTRIVEAVIHLMDMEDGLGRPYDIPQEGLQVVSEVILGWTPLDKFIDVATGRSKENIFPVWAI